MIDTKIADDLLKIPKFVISNNKRQKSLNINAPSIWNKKIFLEGSYNGDSYLFFWKIYQSAKIRIMMNLHVQEDDSKIGIFRIDYNKGHKNPEVLKPSVPTKFHPHVGQKIDTHHVHYHVEGYETLAWALPIDDDEFPYKNISDQLIPDIIVSFAQTINIQTPLFIHKSII